MKIKILSIFILASLITPSFSQALILLPTANLTIIINTQGQDNSFIFNLSDGEQFTLQTDNLSASQTISVVAFGSQYSLSQESVDGLKIGSINCVTDNQNDNISYGTDAAFFSPTVDENLTCTFSNIKGRTPVLIVPGLMGTELKSGNDLLWANVFNMVISSDDSFMDQLAFNGDLKPSDGSVYYANIIKKVPLSNYSDALIVELQSQGYIENQTLFVFPYDWRFGVTATYANGKTNSDLLKEKIQDIMAQTGSDKVDVVAHSMGGLIVKKYVMDNAVDNYIGKAVFVGVPELGAVKTVKALLLGDNFDIDFKGFGLSEAEIKKISANMPSAYDLLPSQQYYDAMGSFVSVIQRQNYTSTQKDLNFQEFENYMAVDHIFNQQALVNSQNLHTSAFDNFDMRTAGVDVYAIDGCKAGTLDKIVETRQETPLGNITAKYETIKFKDGDGTVPFKSAANLPIDASHLFYSLNGEHGKMLSQDGSRQEIVNLISGSSLTVSDKSITQDVNKCGLKKGKVVEKHSPVNILAVDQTGNQSGVKQDGSIINDIPNASYEAFGDQGYLYLPTDDGQTYAITMQGTGAGTYTIKTDDIQNNETVKTQVFSNLPVTTDLTGTVNLGTDGANDSLTVKQNATNQSETILPSPPEVMIQFDPAKKDLVFSSSRDDVTITDNDDTITLKDQAGNVTELKLKDKDRKKSMSAEIKSLKYNGVTADISKNIMQYRWKLDKNKNMTDLTQHVKSRKEYNVNADFDGKNTVFEGKDATGKIKKSVVGLKIITITTNKGDFTWSY